MRREVLYNNTIEFGVPMKNPIFPEFREVSQRYYA
jgi:hypothetical protein